MMGCTLRSFSRKLVPLTPRCDAHYGAWLRGGTHTMELDSAVGCTLRSQTDSKMSVFSVFLLAMSINSIFSKTSEVKMILKTSD